jgi:hypothetical protein
MPELAPLQVGAQAGSLGGPEIEDGDVRPLGSQQDALETQVGGLVDEFVEREACLAPGPGITDRVQESRKSHQV